jgi:hypothetical protein
MNDDKKTKSKRKVIWIHLMIFSILLLGISCQKNNSSSYQDSQKSKKNNEKSTKDLSLKMIYLKRIKAK